MRLRHLMSAIVLLAAIGASGPATASGWLWGLSYEMAAPMGDAKDFSGDSFSFRGVGLETRTWLYNEVTAGISTSWQVFHSKTNDTFSQDGVDVTGTAFRDINSVPIYANMHYYFGQQYDWRPFFGLNIGAMYNEYRVDMGLYQWVEDGWQFAVAPEFGIQMPYDRLLGYVSVRWHYAGSSGSIDETSYFSFRLGIGLR
jgi:hypothetical protein